MEIFDRDGFVKTVAWYFPEDFVASFGFDKKQRTCPSSDKMALKNNDNNYNDNNNNNNKNNNNDNNNTDSSTTTTTTTTTTTNE